MKKIESSQAQLEEKLGMRLRQVDQDQATLTNGICTLKELWRSVHAENELLKKDVKHLSALCEVFRQYCDDM